MNRAAALVSSLRHNVDGLMVDGENAVCLSKMTPCIIVNKYRHCKCRYLYNTALQKTRYFT